MVLRSGVLMILLVSACPGFCEMREIMKSAEIDSLLSKTEKSTDVLIKPNYIISLRVQSGPGSWVTHTDADEIWMVRRGTAKLMLGTITLQMGIHKTENNFDVGPGDVVNVPRALAYQLLPGARFEYIAVQITPERKQEAVGAGARSASAESGSGRGGAPMPYVVPNATIQDTFLKNTSNQPLHTMGVASMNHVIYDGAPGPYEVHSYLDDIYFVRLGSAVAKVDGRLVNPTQTGQGEVRGTGAIGFREYKIGVGDLISIPRNTMHYMDPGSEKLGYLLLKVRSE
jgi:mannose-6-phosphate isomerase-like protein (cupin superfamily)